MQSEIKMPDIKVPAFEMQKIAKREMILIKNDALRGKSQSPNGSSLGNYRSRSYKKYKANLMRRFTDTKTGKKGDYIKGYGAESGNVAKNSNTAFVDETNTGAMFRDMFFENAKDNEVTVSYASKDAGKVLGAEALDRIIVGLNDANQEIIKDMIADYLFKKVDDWAKIPITMTVVRI